MWVWLKPGDVQNGFYPADPQVSPQLLHLPAGPRLRQEGAGPPFSPFQKEAHTQRPRAFMPAGEWSLLGMLLRVTLRIPKWHALRVGVLAVMPKRPMPAGSSLGGHHTASGKASQPWREGGGGVSAGLTASTEAPLSPRQFLQPGQRPRSCTDVRPVRYGPDGRCRARGFMTLALPGGCVLDWQ